MAWVFLVACGSKGSGDETGAGGNGATGGTGATGGAGAMGGEGAAGGGTGGLECTPPEVLIHDPTSSEIVCGGVDEDTKLVPHSDFDACTEPPNSACSHDDFCAVMKCGDPNSMFDAQGCRRKTCADDDDCARGQVCHDTAMQGCLPSAGYACAPTTDGVCNCPANSVCGFEQHCVEPTELGG